MEHKKARPPPPATGRWKPGQSGNPAGRPSSRPFKTSFDRVIRALDPSGDGAAALDRLNAALYAKAVNGDVGAYKELADRYEGKVPNPIGGTNDLPAIRGFTWLSAMPNEPIVEGDEAPQIEDQSTSTDISEMLKGEKLFTSTST